MSLIAKRLSSSAQAVAAAVGLGLAPGAFAAPNHQIDAVHSAAVFQISHLNAGLTHGRFNDIAGTFSIDEAKPSNSKVDITVKTASVDTNHKKRDQHLRSPDFFNAKQFPTLRFVGKSFAKDGAGRVKVTGDLTMHGVTKPVTFVAKKVGEGKDPKGNVRQGWTTTFVLKRSDFGMNFMQGALGDDVEITISLEGVRQ